MSLATFKPRSLTPEPINTSFAFKPINVSVEGDRMYLETATSIGRYSSRNNWIHHDTIGEVHYAIGRTAKLAGYGILIPERTNALGQVVESRDEGVVAEIVSGIYGTYGGLQGLLERYITLMKVTGEGYLIRVPGDGYWILSPDEIDASSFTSTGRVDLSKPIKWITAPVAAQSGGVNQFIIEVQPEDFLGRIWNPSKRFAHLADSPLGALNTVCEELTMLTNSIKGRLMSRFALSGLLLIPSEANDANIAGPTPGAEHSDKVISYLITMMSRNIMNHDDPLAHIPGILKAPGAVLETVRHMVFETAIDERDMELRAELAERILGGLDVQKQKSRDENANHWGDWANSEDELRVSVAPDLRALAHGALTKAILRRELMVRMWTPGRIAPWRVGVDLSEAAVRTNQAEDFRQAWDRGGIVNETAIRRSIGAKEDDASTGAEKVRAIGIKLQDPYLATYGLDEQKLFDWEKIKTTKPTGPAAGPGQPGRAGPGVGSPGSPGGQDRDTPKSRTPQ